MSQADDLALDLRHHNAVAYELQALEPSGDGARLG
jgi:hypothetical protein